MQEQLQNQPKPNKNELYSTPPQQFTPSPLKINHQFALPQTQFASSQFLSVNPSLFYPASLPSPVSPTKHSNLIVFNSTTGAFKCEKCDKHFHQLAHLKIHERKHTGEKPYVCSFENCKKSFTQLGNLRTHERKHTGEKPFKCTFPGCSKGFSQMGNMKTHELLHLGVKPFLCMIDNCEKGFSQLGNLKSHQIKVHSEKPEAHVETGSDDEIVDEEEEPSDPVPIKKRRKSRSKDPSSTSSTAAKKATSKRSKPRSRSKKASIGEDDESVKSVTSSPTLFDLDEEEEEVAEIVAGLSLGNSFGLGISVEEKLLIKLKAVLDHGTSGYVSGMFDDDEDDYGGYYYCNNQDITGCDHEGKNGGDMMFVMDEDVDGEMDEEIDVCGLDEDEPMVDVAAVALFSMIST